MRLVSARIFGFQSFTDSGEILLSDGINLIVGQNNSGKSALLRSLLPALADDRHRTPESWEDYRLRLPEVDMTIAVSGRDIEAQILQTAEVYIPIPERLPPEEYLEGLFSKSDVIVSIASTPGGNWSAEYPGHGLFKDLARDRYAILITTNNGKSRHRVRQDANDSIPFLIKNIWSERMFYFAAERMNIGLYTAEDMKRLSPNADNLPAVLLTLNGNRGDLFRKLVGHVREIFPTVGNISVRPVSNGKVEVRTWPTESMERFELSFPLTQSGTGVSQVLSILSVVMTVDDAVIIIDEINSFLHPAAVKSLIRILQTEYGNHQYIISTHAPEVISYSNPRTIHLVKRDNYESIVTKLDLTEIDNFREIAIVLGISMSDVFAADKIIWVEGQTEELCFPLLYQHSTGRVLPRGILFTSVVATGDFNARRRDRELIYEIYKRLSSAATPLVSSVAFSFDSENLTEEEKSEMVRGSRGALHFLPRRHLECYLINPDAIAKFISDRDPHLSISADETERKLLELASGERKIDEWNGNIWDPTWLARVDAARLISAACDQLSQHRVTFNKKNDTLYLLQRVQAENPDQIRELATYVASLLENSERN